ncbi:branched-chain amino acid ABC transporter permease [Chloroflexota bacterium]
MPIKKSYIGGICGLIILALIPLFVGEYILLVLTLICVNVLLACSLRVSMNAGQLNFAVPAFYAIGGYCSALMVVKLGIPWIVAFFAAGVLAALVSLVIGYPSLRLKYVYFLMLTLGFVEVVRTIATRWESLTGGAIGLPHIPPVSIVGIEFASKASQYYFTLFVTLVIIFVLYRLESSRFGLTIKSIRQAEELGETVGINTYRFKVLAFAISSFFCGLTGSIYAHNMTFIQPVLFGFMLSATIIVYLFVGGLGRFSGPILGAVALSLLTEPLRGLQYYERIFYAIALVGVVLFLPGGLLGLPARLSPLIKRLRRSR